MSWGNYRKNRYLERADASFLEDPVKEVQEFEYICENIEIEEQGKADNNDDEQTYNEQCNNQLEKNERHRRPMIMTTKQQRHEQQQ